MHWIRRLTGKEKNKADTEAISEAESDEVKRLKQEKQKFEKAHKEHTNLLKNQHLSRREIYRRHIQDAKSYQQKTAVKKMCFRWLEHTYERTKMRYEQHRKQEDDRYNAKVQTHTQKKGAIEVEYEEAMKKWHRKLRKHAKRPETPAEEGPGSPSIQPQDEGSNRSPRPCVQSQSIRSHGKGTHQGGLRSPSIRSQSVMSDNHDRDTAITINSVGSPRESGGRSRDGRNHSQRNILRRPRPLEEPFHQGGGLYGAFRQHREESEHQQSEHQSNTSGRRRRHSIRSKDGDSSHRRSRKSNADDSHSQ